MKMSECFNLLDFNYNSPSESMIKKRVDLIKEKYVSQLEPDVSALR